MTVGDVSLDDHIHSWYVCIWGCRYRYDSLGWACMVTLYIMQSNPTHPLGRNQSPSLKKKLGVQRRPQRTPYPQEESLQHLAVDQITGVNASRGPIQSYPTATPDQHLDTPPWIAPRESHIKLPVAKNRLGQVHPHCLQCLPLGLVDSHGKCGPQQELPLAESKRHPLRVRGNDVEARNENALALVRSCGNLSINYVLHKLDHNKPSAIWKAARHIPQQNHWATFLQGQSVGWHPWHVEGV